MLSTSNDNPDAAVEAGAERARTHAPLVVVLDFPGGMAVEVTVRFMTRDLAGVLLTDAHTQVPEHHGPILQVVGTMLARNGQQIRIGRTEPPDAGKKAPNKRAAIALTPRQIEIISMIAAGVTSQEIAAILDISVLTVRTHRQNLMKKLRLRNAAEITGYAIKHGLYAAR